MLQYDFEQSIGYWLVRTSMAYERALNAELAPRGITYRQAQVLGWLVSEGDMSQSELAERMHVEPPTLVGILDRMERDGWIARMSCASDRRKKIIRVQPQAEPVWADIVACAMDLRARASDGVEEADMARVRDILSRILQNVGAPESQKANA